MFTKGHKINLGKKRDCYWLKGRNEEKNFCWKGDKVGYIGLHKWVARQVGQPSKCENPNCKYPRTSKSGRWLEFPKRFDWANKSGEYKRQLDDWIRLCRSCHIIMDRGL